MNVKSIFLCLTRHFYLILQNNELNLIWGQNYVIWQLFEAKNLVFQVHLNLAKEQRNLDKNSVATLVNHEQGVIFLSRFSNPETLK